MGIIVYQGGDSWAIQPQDQSNWSYPIGRRRLEEAQTIHPRITVDRVLEV